MDGKHSEWSLQETKRPLFIFPVIPREWTNTYCTQKAAQGDISA